MSIDVIDTSAIRAIYQSERDMPRVQIEFTTHLGEHVRYELDFATASQFRKQLISVLKVIAP